MTRPNAYPFALLLGVCAVACDGGPTSEPSASNRAAGTLDLALPSVEGEIVELQATRDSDVFVLAFWATWCQPCQQELTKMGKLYQDKAPRGLQLYAISIDGPDTVAQVGPWVQREGYPFPVLIDRETQVLFRYNPRGDIPYYVVLDARGKVLKDHQGYVTGDIDELDDFLERTLPAS